MLITHMDNGQHYLENENWDEQLLSLSLLWHRNREVCWYCLQYNADIDIATSSWEVSF